MSEGETQVDKQAKKKSVGFAPLPEEELNEHHANLRKIHEEKLKSNPFHKIPPELSYLEKRPLAPKPLGQHKKETKTNDNYGHEHKMSEIRDLRSLAFKEIATQNKNTELNFNYGFIYKKIPLKSVMVDVKYVSLTSYDLDKLNKYAINMSNDKVVLGHTFTGEIIQVGSKIDQTATDYKVGAQVIGMIDPTSKRGSLSSTLVVDTYRDTLIVLTESEIESIKSMDTYLSFEDGTEFDVGSDDSSVAQNDREEQSGTEGNNGDNAGKVSAAASLPPLGKIALYPVLYNRAKQVLTVCDSKINKSRTLRVLINGADTALGLTIFQILTSPDYLKRLDHLHLILITREQNEKKLLTLARNQRSLRSDIPCQTRFGVIPFDMMNDDLILPGEKVPLNYKKPNFFAAEILQELFELTSTEITPKTLNEHLVDLFVDIVGSKKYFQTLSIRFAELQSTSLPFMAKIQDQSLVKLLRADTKEPFFQKIMKPKNQQCGFVSCCNYYTPTPTYKVDELFDHSVSDSSLNPWLSGWGSGFANSFSNYYYYDETALRQKKGWLEEGLKFFLDGHLKFQVDHVIDWRNNFKKVLSSLRNEDSQVLFEIEEF